MNFPYQDSILGQEGGCTEDVEFRIVKDIVSRWGKVRKNKDPCLRTTIRIIEPMAIIVDMHSFEMFLREVV